MVILAYAPIILFVLLLIEAIVEPFFTKKVVELKEVLQAYNEMEEENKEGLFSSVDDSLVPNRIEINLDKETGLFKDTEGVEEVKVPKGFSLDKLLEKAIRHQIATKMASNLTTRLLTNAGFLILLFTGHWVGAFVGLITFVFVSSAVNMVMITEKESPMLSWVSGLLIAVLYHGPLLLAFFVW